MFTLAGNFVRLEIWGVICVLAICSVASLMRWLTIGGAIAAACVGYAAWSYGGFALALCLVTFFACSSALTFLGKPRGDTRPSSARNAVQVLCNGGAATAFCIFGLVSHDSRCWFAAAACYACANSDTWATEIGRMSNGRVVRATNFARTSIGASGGVSLRGTFAAACGSLLIALVAMAAHRMTTQSAALIAIIGFVGCLLDSVLGDLFQPHFRNGEQVFDDEQVGSNRSYGLSLLNNHAVNLLSTTAAGVLGYFFAAA
ncbi:MAG: DUF92 domain-containing protein [Fimbriimonadales bacterium]